MTARIPGPVVPLALAALLLATPVGAATPADMAAIPGGTYVLGHDRGARDARPAHAVTLRPFRIDRREVTNREFALFLDALNLRPLRDGPAPFRPGEVAGPDAHRLFEGREGEQRRPLAALDDEHARLAGQGGRFVAAPGWEDHPVAEVTWDGAVAYCRWRDARLPTEAEWEAAARGPGGRTRPWGETTPTKAHAAIGRRSGQTAPVGAHPLGATPEGVHDLAGNLQEWTSSLYRPYPYDPGDGREDPADPGERVTRGGDHVFDDAAGELTGFHRTGFSRAPDRGHRQIGFRCAADG